MILQRSFLRMIAPKLIQKDPDSYLRISCKPYNRKHKLHPRKWFCVQVIGKLTFFLAPPMQQLVSSFKFSEDRRVADARCVYCFVVQSVAWITLALQCLILITIHV